MLKTANEKAEFKGMIRKKKMEEDCDALMMAMNKMKNASMEAPFI